MYTREEEGFIKALLRMIRKEPPFNDVRNKIIGKMYGRSYSCEILGSGVILFRIETK